MPLLLVPVAVAFGLSRAGLDWQQVGQRMRSVNLGIFLLAAAAYYLSFLVRALRWRLLLTNAGERNRSTPVLVEILLISWFLNCVTPARMGDVARAYMLRQRQRVSTQKALGTVVAERVVDVVALLALLIAAGAAVFRTDVPHQLVPPLLAGGAVCVMCVAGLATLAVGHHAARLPFLSATLVSRIEGFRCGAIGSLGTWHVLIPLTVAVWGCEALRLGLVVAALGDGHLISAASILLVALLAALLSCIPFLPGGVGLVEGGMVMALGAVAQLSGGAALPIVLLDRCISYVSLIAVGALLMTLGSLCLRSRRPVTMPAQGARQASPGAVDVAA